MVMVGTDLSHAFIRFRWCAFIGQLLVLFFATYFFGLTLPQTVIISWLLLIPATNLCIYWRPIRHFSERTLVGCLLVIDTGILTAVLCEAGGATNPFTIVYLLHVVLAAIMLNPIWAWSIAAFSSLGFALLFIFPRPVPEWEIHGVHQGFSLHLHGMLFAYITAAAIVAYFLNKIAGDLRNKEQKLQRFQYLAANQQRLAALTAITAGAAHELGTPLSTIAVIGRELELAIAKRCPDYDLLEDLSLLKSETLRCKDVLQQLAEKTGELFGEAPQSVTVSQLIQDAVASLNTASAGFNVSGAVDIVLFKVPKRALALTLRALIKNSLEASGPTRSPVEITAQDKGAAVLLEISDRGVGMDAATIERIGEPFFSTKKVGNGMGLGVYISKLTVEQLGGSLVFQSTQGQGTCARLTLPIDCSLTRTAA